MADATYQNVRVPRELAAQIKSILRKPLNLQIATEQMLRFALGQVTGIEPSRILFKEAKAKKENK